MAGVMKSEDRGTGGDDPTRCPVRAGMVSAGDTPDAVPNTAWSAEARQRLEAVPEGFCRDMTAKAAETLATHQGQTRIDSGFVEQILDTFQSGSAAVSATLPWDDPARERIARAPDMVRGMLAKEIEGWAARNGLGRVTEEAVDAVKALWQERGVFHLDPNDPRSG